MRFGEHSRPDLMEWAEGIKDSAKENFATDGYLAPACMALVQQEGKWGTILYPITMENEREKDFVSFVIHKLCEDFNVFGVVFVSEAWMLQCKDNKDMKKEIEKSGSIGEHPDRIERLMISFESYSGNKMWTIDIERDEDNAWLGEENDMSNMQFTKGRFTNFLKPMN